MKFDKIDAILIAMIAMMACVLIWLGYEIAQPVEPTMTLPDVSVSVTSTDTDTVVTTKTVVTTTTTRVVVSHKTPQVSPAKAIFDKEYPKYKDVPYRELLALTVALYGEARGESWMGIAAVADTIRNRVSSKLFPDSYLGVVTQRSQFSCITNKNDLFDNARLSGQPDRVKFKKLMNTAHRTINGEMPRMTTNALFYHTKTVHPFWSKHYSRLGSIGDHIFYTTTRL